MKLKNLFLVTALLSFGITSVNAQNTWVKKLTYNMTSWGYYDSLTGLKKVEVAANGSVYVLANVHCHGLQNIYKFSPNSNQLEWIEYVGYNGMSINSYSPSIYATSDLGVLECQNSIEESLFEIYGHLKKFSPGGALEWEQSFGYLFSGMDYTIYDAIESSTGNYYALIDDSMYTFDALGNRIDSTGAVHGTQLIEMTNGDLLVRQGNSLMRTGISGNVTWTQPCSGPFAYDSTFVFLVHSGTWIKKVDALTGAQVWDRNYGLSPVSAVEATHDGGFMASIGYRPMGPYSCCGVPSAGILFRTDSLGDTLYTRTYPFPYYGLSTIKRLQNGNIVSGGAYLSDYQLGGPHDYSAFCCVMNPDGSYPLQQTDYVSPSDADNNNLRYFVDDALELMQAFGRTGSPRDSAADGVGPYTGCNRVDVAIDWNTSTPDGVNDKFKDFDGNGIVDTNDLHLFNTADCWHDSAEMAFRTHDPGQLANIEEFCLVPVEDTVIFTSPGDTVSFYMILGNSGNPVDSIYGLAFSYSADTIGNYRAHEVAVNSSGFGTPGVDLHAFLDFYSHIYNNPQFRSHTLVSRTDHQNALNVSDTIGIIHFSGFTLDTLILVSIADFKAILQDGTVIPFATCSYPVVALRLVSAGENDSRLSGIFPNPANDFIHIPSSLTGRKHISILNGLGEKVKDFQTDETESKVFTGDLAEGFYVGTLEQENKRKWFSFVVSHNEQK